MMKGLRKDSCRISTRAKTRCFPYGGRRRGWMQQEEITRGAGENLRNHHDDEDDYLKSLLPEYVVFTLISFLWEDGNLIYSIESLEDWLRHTLIMWITFKWIVWECIVIIISWSPPESSSHHPDCLWECWSSWKMGYERRESLISFSPLSRS